jgi:Fur family ferric uptake transcriptional regulator
VVEALLASDGHLSAEEIIESVPARLPDVAESGLYRTLSALGDLEVVTHVHLGHGPDTFHIGDQTHRHLVCATCHGVIEIPLDLLGEVAERLEKRYGLSIDVDTCDSLSPSITTTCSAKWPARASTPRAQCSQHRPPARSEQSSSASRPVKPGRWSWPACYSFTACDIAEREPIPIGTAKTPIRRGLQRLRAHLVTDPTEHVATTKPTRKETNAPAATRCQTT